ncbi:MAG: TCR/Tet family MFS transporter [Bacteroidetes bacterium]|nr:TCR/Tet family MFS transporter [Bacteroidota bacterium]
MPRVKNPLVFIFITVLIDCIGIRIIYPVAATIVAEVSHVSVNEAITYSGWIMACYAAMQFIFSPLLGSLSDRYGRRPVLLLSLFGLVINYIFLALANTLPLLFMGRIITGICGASLSTSYAYVADISVPEKRAQNFGIIGAAIGLGFIIGPFIGGMFSELGTRAPFIAAACLSFLNWLYGFFILPESLKPENRRAFDIRRANPFGAFMQLKNNRRIRTLMLVLFLIFMAGQVMPSIWPFYTKYLYHWSDLEIGYSLAFVGLMVALVKGGLIQWSQQKFGSVKSVYLGLLFHFTGLLLFAWADQAWMAYAFTLVYCLGGIAPPSLQGIISGRVPDNEQGELQGIITSLMSISNIVSPLIMSHLFAFFTSETSTVHFPGAAFALAALAVFAAFMLCLWKLKKVVPA